MKTSKLNRRDFLKLSGMSGAVLALGYYIPSFGETRIIKVKDAEDLGITLNHFILINNKGEITLVNQKPEMGQGVYQAMPMLIAEELEVDMDDVKIMQAPADEKKYGHQQAGGSFSIRGSWTNMLTLGAAGREMLKQAAANKWQVSLDNVYAEKGFIINKNTKEKLPYGDLVEEASKLTPPENIPLKKKKDFKVLGKPLIRKDARLKTNGEAVFGIDVKVPGMLYATVERSPVFFGKVVSFDDSEAKKIPGVKAIFKTEMPVFQYTREGVAVVADNYWTAVQGRKALKITWDESGYDQLNSKELFDKYKEEAKKEGITAHQEGDFDANLSKSSKTVEGWYQCPFEAHSPMEPMNIVVSAKEDSCDVWAPSQSPNWIRKEIASAIGLQEEQVNVNITFLGGGFGRRAFTDFPVEAALISKKVKAPVKVIWTREDDTTQGPFRPGTYNTFRAGLDENNNLMALEKKAVYQELGHQWKDAKLDKVGKLEGANKAYNIPHSIEKVVPQMNQIPVMWWRSVYASTNGFAMEAFMDEVSVAAGKDPIDFRIELLADHPRFIKILETLKDKSKWKSNKENGYGVSIVESFGSTCGEVVEISQKDGKIKIEKVTAVIDCGMYVNPDTIRAQVEGSIVMGYQAAITSEITFDRGRAVEQNFNTFKMPKMQDIPPIEIYIIENEEKPGGVGEPGLPPFAGALVNAIFDKTGKRIRTLPLNLETI